MKLSRFFLFAAVFLIVCYVKIIAQDAVRPTLPPGKDADAASKLPEVVIEVRRNDGCAVSPIYPKWKYGSLVYTLPRSSKIPPDSAGKPITSKVLVTAKRSGEQWDVKVIVGTGEFYDAGDTTVGEFKLNLNERANVPDVARFGLNPIRVGVVKIVRKDAGEPSFQNLTQSISLESMQAHDLPDPFELKLKNGANFDVVAIQYNTFARGRFIALKWLGAGDLKPLIKVGDTFTLKAPSEDNACGDDDGYTPNQLNRIDLVSAVFADGSYEGQPGLPALIKGTALGNYNNLQRVIDPIRVANDAAELSQLLKSLSEAMNEETEPYTVELLRSMFSVTLEDTAALNGFIRSGMHGVKVSLMRDSEYLRFISEKGSPQVIKAMVERTRSKYEQWFIAARNMTSR